jgi:alkanesulfonate monooxygenase SsuD/methylene tetrahydromethanopterin reductase-like flavin-dependent oxidoreductase (luciferase family)
MYSTRATLAKVKFGVCLPIHAGASAFDYSINIKSIKSIVKSSEDLGFDSLWVCDHLTMGQNGNNLEAWTVLSAASQLCESMRLGTLVLCATHRPPALLAKMGATLDVISNGRLELGLGAGWRRSEQVSYGLPWEESVKDRLQRFVETIEIVKGMWTQDMFNYDGRYYHIKDAICNPKPVQKPHPRIMLAGRGEKTALNLVAKYADAWNIDEVTPAEYSAKLKVLRSHCSSAGTDFDHIEKSLENFILITEKEEELTKVVEWSNWAAESVQSEYGNRPAIGTLEEMKSKYILGSVKQVTARLSEYIDVGVQQFMLYYLDFPSLNSLRLLADDVIPSL